MKNIKHELLIWVHLISLFGIWFGLLFILQIPIGFNNEALLKLPEVVTVYLILSFIFTKWIWRLPFLQGWLIKYPDLQGTWQGNLQTTWKNPETGKIPGPIPMILVIKQSFDTINCVMHTQESTSYSNASMLSEDDESGIQRISYNYTNTPDTTIRGRSAIHYGAAILRIIKEGKKYSLVGEYWTSRSTAGNISLTLRSKELLGAFPQDLVQKIDSSVKNKKRKGRE